MQVWILVAMAIAAPSLALAQTSPYAGQEAREIKALSAQAIDDLRQGRGMGLAKAAELHSYPGPAHVLAMADKLGLDDRQVTSLTGVKTRMTMEAMKLGSRILEREEALDRMFAQGRAAKEAVEAVSLEIGELQGRLRAVHLVAHVETTALLTKVQVRRYDAVRGYRSDGGHEKDAATPDTPHRHHHEGKGLAR